MNVVHNKELNASRREFIKSVKLLIFSSFNTVILSNGNFRAKERQKKKERLKKLREQGVELGPSRKRLKKNSMANSSCKIQVAVDCSFDHLMNDKVCLSRNSSLSSL